METAVSMLKSRLADAIDWNNPYHADILNAALEEEKRQIMDGYDDGHSDGYHVARENDELVIYTNSEDYYNETFKSEQE